MGAPPRQIRNVRRKNYVESREDTLRTVVAHLPVGVAVTRRRSTEGDCVPVGLRRSAWI